MHYEKLSILKRIEYLRMVEGSREALIPSSFSIIDIVTYLFYNKLILVDKVIPDILISKGHAASVLYPFISEKENLEINYASDGSSFGIYSNVEIPYIHMPSGSLGHGLGVAIGLALTQSELYSNRKIFVVLGDGECFEGSIWEALMYISNSKINSIIPVIDYNDRTILGDISKTYPNYNLDSKLSGFGFNVLDFDGHDFEEISKNVSSSLKSDSPSCLLARTVKGKGITFMEESYLWHNRMPNEDLFNKAISELELKL